MAFTYHRTVHFPDTDAAGVVFFPNYLAICHEAYEEALAAAGLDLRTFFSPQADTLVPIARSEAEYLRPLVVGDRLRVSVAPTRVSEHAFAIEYALTKLGPPEKLAARLRTEHVCISTRQRERAPLPPALATWVDGG